MSNEHIDAMIAAANDQKPVEFSQAFGAAMMQAVGERIEAARPAVAAAMFEPPAGE